MKILVVSDTHRKLENLKVILEREQPMDLLIHLGDAEGDEDSIAEMAGCRLEIVAGNNDFFSNLPREKELRIGSYRVLITHGHYYYVSAGIADIEREAAAQGYDIVMFGHTHRPVIVTQGCDCAQSGQSLLSEAGGEKTVLHCDGSGQKRKGKF